MRPTLEVADIFRRHGEAFRRSHGAHLGRIERRVMAAIELCRTPALGGHVEQCGDCGLVRCAYNSCRNRHCPKCQGLARAEWLEARQAELLPVPYYHVVFTLPPPVAEIAFQNKRAVYAILFHAAAEAMRDIAAEPRHLGAEIGAVAVLHTWGQTLQHHPHLHCIVPGGGLSPDQTRWVACRPGFFLPVRVLSRRFRTLFLARLQAAFVAGELRFSGTLAALAAAQRLRRTSRYPARGRMGGLCQAPVRRTRAGAGLSRPLYPSRRAGKLSSHPARRRPGRLHLERLSHHGKTKVLTLAADEFIRRFLLHAVPNGFHRIRHVGFLANGHRTAKLALCRALLAAPTPEPPPAESYRERTRRLTGHALDVCPDCGGVMLERGPLPRRPQPQAPFWCDSS